MDRDLLLHLSVAAPARRRLGRILPGRLHGPIPTVHLQANCTWQHWQSQPLLRQAAQWLVVHPARGHGRGPVP
eukprot:3446485-Alexandrium_andersonii.AAC.1